MGFWSSENAAQPGAAVDRNDSLPAPIVSPGGFSPPDTFGVHSVAFCSELLGCDVGALDVAGVGWLALGELVSLVRPTTTRATTAITPNIAIPARINHGVFERGPFGGGPGGPGG